MQTRNSIMKTKYSIVFICIVALVIIEKESSIISRVSDKIIQSRAPPLDPHSPLDNSNTTQNGPLSMLKMLLSTLSGAKGNSSNFSDEQEDDELDHLGTYNSSQGRKHVLLLARTRTGSSFVGEIFNHHGENMFYLFEPLWHVERFLSLGKENYNGTMLGRLYKDVLRGLFLCDFNPLEKFISPPPEEHVTAALFRREMSLSLCEDHVCSPFDKEVYEPYRCRTRRCGPLNLTLASESCLSKQYHVIKTVRVPNLESLQPLVEDPRLDVRLIQLVRDPRAILASRMAAFDAYEVWKAWGQDGQVPEDDYEVKKLKGNCDQIKMSAEVGLSHPHWLRKRYMLVRYEDIALYPMQKAEDMYRFAGIPFSPQARDWILRNTAQEEGDEYSTRKNSSEHAEKWRFSMPFTLVQVVQRVCEPHMKMFGYRIVDDEKTLINKSISLLEDRQFQ
ncbi:carbohydrate sulfotransferase 3-like [Limanda limanda]|uniref:carbohydrate sulfotransferase 3-like n=1 Tax=Limanda limanda TaxID=27771 RepID=UPI0029C6A50F|nr:carbohydrate sulfotransferase 3-like [Limanda limanda]